MSGHHLSLQLHQQPFWRTAAVHTASGGAQNITTKTARETSMKQSVMLQCENGIKVTLHPYMSNITTNSTVFTL